MLFHYYSYCEYRYGEIFILSLNTVNPGRRRMKCTELGIELGPILPKACIFLGEEKEMKVKRINGYFHFYVFYKGINYKSELL